MERVRRLQDGGQLGKTDVAEVMRNCITDGILPDFLKKYGTELIEMLFRELTREEDMAISLSKYGNEPIVIESTSSISLILKELVKKSSKLFEKGLGT